MSIALTYSVKNVLVELARCLGLFPNLHTVQIDVDIKSKLPLAEIFEQTFKTHSYPQIRNVFIMHLSASFVASCPWARRVGFTRNCSMSKSCLETALRNCAHLEALEVFASVLLLPNLNACNLIVNRLPNLCTIQIMIIYYAVGINLSSIDILKELNHLQNIVLKILPPMANVLRLPIQEFRAYTIKLKKDWIKLAKRILVHIQLRDNLEKTIVVQDHRGYERRILIKPKSLAGSEFT